MALTTQVKEELDLKAQKCADEFRCMWNLRNEPLTDIYSLVMSKEFLLLRFPNNSTISGIYLEKKDRDKIYKCIYINNFEPLGRQNLTIAHELYHAFFEKSRQGACFEDSVGNDPIEWTATRFASYLLIPRDYLVNILKKLPGRVSIEQIFDLQKIFSVSFQALIYSISEVCKSNQYINIDLNSISWLYKYNHKKYWDELSTITQNYDTENMLNTGNPKYEFPTEFRQNLINNYQKGRVDTEDINEIFDFFNEEFKG